MNDINDDFCDLLSKKICDNCGKCLELEGIDTKAINIEDISKSVEENEFLENELKKAASALEEESESKEEIEEDYDSLIGESSSEDEYIDAFDHIVYFDEIGLEEDSSIEDLTEEIYPGIRKLKKHI